MPGSVDMPDGDSAARLRRRTAPTTLDIPSAIKKMAAAFTLAYGGLVYASGLDSGLPRASPTIFDERGHLILSPEHYVHAAACVAFAVALLVSTTSYVWSPQGTKKQVALVVCFINGVACSTYLGLAAGLTCLVESQTGELVEPVRYLQWMFTTPAFILLLTCLVKPETEAAGPVRHAIIADQIMIITGFFERYYRPPFREVLLLISCAAFAKEMINVNRLFISADEKMAVPADRTVLTRLRRITFLVWSLFPVVRFLSLTGLASLTAEEMMFVCLDLLAKLGYSVSLMVGNFTLIDQVLENRLMRYEELFQVSRTQEEDATMLDGLYAAYAEADSWKRERQQRMLNAGVPENQAEAFLDAAVGEYVALAHGQLGAYGIPSLRPHAE